MYRYSLLIRLSIVCLLTTPAVSAKSLYQENGFKPLHADKRAFAIGDSITILIYENAQAATSAGEGRQADVSFSGGASIDERNWNSGLNIGSSGGGDASTNRNGFVKAQLTAVVVSTGQKGVLHISGEQKIRINDEEQIIRVSGSVRGEDISHLNTVSSFRIQNAVISIDGQGEISKGKEGNVFVRLFKWMGF